MAISREKKQQVVAELKEMLTRSESVVLSDFRGLTAGQMTDLRNRLRPLDSRFMVAKNRLIKRSLEEVGLPELTEMLQGPTALSFLFGEFGQPLREMQQFARETSLLGIKGGLLGDRVLDAQDVQTLASLPPLEVLKGQTLGTVQSPIGGFMGLLEGALRGLLYALSARVDQIGEAA